MAAKMSRAEIAGRVAVKSRQLGDPARVLAEIGGPAAFDDLVDILRNEPEPPGLDIFEFRCNVIKLLGALGEERVIGPLLECHELYRAVEELTLAALKQAGVSFPLRYNGFMFGMMLRINKPKPPNFRELPGYERLRQKFDRSHLREASWEEFIHLAQFSTSRPRLGVVRALEELAVESKRQALAYIFELEHQGNRDVLTEVATALGRLGDPRGIDELGQYLEEAAGGSESLVQIIRLGSTDSIKHIIDDLCGMGDPRARQWVQNFYDKCTDTTKQHLRLYAGWRLGLNSEPKKAVAAPEPKAAKEAESKCFLATAACGSADAPELAPLRRFREQRLRPYRAGRAAIAIYERFSPPLAEFIRPRPWLRVGVRFLVLKPALFALAFFPGVQTGVECARSE